MGYFDHVMMTGLPPVVLDFHLSGVLSMLALLAASLLAIMCGRGSELMRRIVTRRRSGSERAQARRPSSKAAQPIPLGRAIRLTTGSRK